MTRYSAEANRVEILGGQTNDMVTNLHLIGWNGQQADNFYSNWSTLSMQMVEASGSLKELSELFIQLSKLFDSGPE